VYQLVSGVERGQERGRESGGGVGRLFYSCLRKIARLALRGRPSGFEVEVCARFGSPDYDSNSPPICLLCADGRCASLIYFCYLLIISKIIY
jgi:hypothetical protein